MVDAGRPHGETGPEKRFRSPPYPFIALPAALERVRSLYEKVGAREVGFEALGLAWGYGPDSSGLLQTAAALRQFGLITHRGTRRARNFQLTSEAIHLAQGKPTSSQERALLQRIALRPKIFAELDLHFGGRIHDEDALRRHLTHGRTEAGEAPYSDAAAKEVIARYKATITYAGLAGSAEAPPGEDKMDIGQGGTSHADPQRPPPGTDERLMEGERDLAHGILGRETSFRLLVRGPFGVKEMDRLIAKMQFDREILADEEEGPAPAPGREA